MNSARSNFEELIESLLTRVPKDASEFENLTPEAQRRMFYIDFSVRVGYLRAHYDAKQWSIRGSKTLATLLTDQHWPQFKQLIAVWQTDLKHDENQNKNK